MPDLTMGGGMPDLTMGGGMPDLTMGGGAVDMAMTGGMEAMRPGEVTGCSCRVTPDANAPQGLSWLVLGGLGLGFLRRRKRAPQA
jgi:MYXO-CTERM domain-containing protein